MIAIFKNRNSKKVNPFPKRLLGREGERDWHYSLATICRLLSLYILLSLPLATFAQTEEQQLTAFVNQVAVIDDIYSEPYRPQIIRFPNHGRLEWLDSEDILGIIGQNTLLYHPREDFLGKDSIDIGYWKMGQFGPMFTRQLIIYEYLPLPITLEGSLYLDANDDCSRQLDEKSIAHWLVRATQGAESFFAWSDENGHYEMALDTGIYQITAVPLDANWMNCAETYDVQIETYDPISFDLPIQSIIDAFYLEVEIATNDLRPCEQNTYNITYRNKGTETATDAFIELKLDEALVLESSELAFTAVSDHVYLFHLDSLKAGEYGKFNISVQLDCETLIGQKGIYSYLLF